ncbi:MAG: hypothetical protein ACXW04_11835 [Methylobacter sp.]
MSNLENRILKLEQRQPDSSNEWVRLIIESGEAEQIAIEKWLSEKTARPVPGNIIFRVMV